MANKRFIDFPIATTVGDNDIILIWQGGANKQTTKATILSGVPDSLNDLTDVTISGLTNGQILRYDSVTGQWENTDQGNLDLNDLNDVTIVSPTNGQVLVYNSSTSKWENSSGGYVPYVGAVTTVNLGAQTIQAGSFVKQSGTSSQFLKADGSVDSTAYGTGSVTSVGLTMPAAFNVANSPVTTAGTLAVTGAGTVAQYIRGDGSLADFPESSGGGSSVSYYLNGSVDQGTIAGIAYKELSKVPILGAGTDFTINADGYIASFITDAGDPNLLEIPGGNWNFETYFSASSSGGTPTFYVELYKVSSGGTATLIASSSSSPELIAFGTNLNPYFSTLAVPTTTLALTDRLAVRYYVTHSGRTITLHTENNHLCQIVTTFTTGITALNGLTAQVQNFAVGTTGTDFNIASATATHTFNLPTASATNRGALSSADWSLFTQAYNDKINSAAVTGTTTKTLTLTQQDGGTITASWSDLNTDAVLSVFGRTGAVVAANGDYTTAQVTESGNLYYTEARVNANANVAANTAARHNAVTLGTANGLSLSTQVLSLGLASAGVTGALSGTDWSTFNSKANSDGSNASGTWGINITGNAATVGTFAETAFAVNQRGGNISLNTVLDNNGLRNGMYRVDSGVTSSPNSARFWALNVYGNQSNVVSQIASDFQTGETFVRGYNSAWSAWRRVWDNVNLTSPITSVTASSPLASSGGTTPNITIQQASGSQSGFLSSTDWTTFNNKQNALTNPVTGTGTTNYLPKFTGSTTIGNSALQETSGNLGLGVTPSAWNSSVKVIEIANTGNFIGNSGNDNWLATNTIYDSGATFRYARTGSAVAFYSQSSGGHFWFNAPIGTAGNAISLNQAMTLTLNNNLLVGTPTDNGARLQVEHNGNSPLLISTSSTTLFTTYRSNSVVVGYIGNGDGIVTSGGATNFGIRAENDLIFTSGGNNRRLTISSTGAATFSSSVAASLFSGNLTVGSATVGGQVKLDYGANAASRSWRLVSDAYNYGDFSIQQSTTQAGLTYSDKFLISATGNVGIGTPSPAALTEINPGNITNGGAAKFALAIRSGGTTYLDFYQGWNSTIAGQSILGTTLVSSDALAFASSGVERMRITLGGNVGIGTPSPATRLMVQDSANTFVGHFSGLNQANGIAIGTNSSNVAVIQGYTRTFSATNNIAMQTDGGNVLIGTTTDNGERLQVNGTSTISGNIVLTNGVNRILRIGSSTNYYYDLQTVGDNFQIREAGSTPRLTFTYPTGAATFSSSVTATSFFESSDATLKTLIADNYQAKGIDSVIAKLYIKNGKEELGYFAQDLQGVLPSAVSKGSDGLLNLSYREVHTAKIAYLEEEIRQLKKRYEIN